MTFRPFVRRWAAPVLVFALVVVCWPIAASALDILDWMRDPQLFGGSFAGPSWSAWRAVLATAFGLPLTPEQFDVARAVTRRSLTTLRAYAELWIAAGRRAGKSRICAALGVFIAASRDYTSCCAPGEVAMVMILAGDRKQARVIFRYVRALLDSAPLLRALVVSETRESITLSTGACIEIHVSSYRSTRGYSCAAVICDEAAFWPDVDGSANPAAEVITALRPALITIPDSLLVVISSVYSRRGIFYETFRLHEGADDSPVLTCRAPTRMLNPTVPEHAITAALAQDESSARAEYLGEWRADLEALLSRELLDRCTVARRVELPAASELHYVGFVDPSGGSGADSFTAAVAHVEQGRVILDAVRETKPPLSPSAVVASLAQFFRGYRIQSITGDRYAGLWPRERFAEHGITYTPAEQTRSEYYLQLVPLLNSTVDGQPQVELLDIPRLHGQLASLERRTGRGRDTVDAPARLHEDLANSSAGVIVTAHEQARRCIVVQPGGSECSNPFGRF